MGLLSDRAEKTSRLVVLPSSLEDPRKAPPGLYWVGLLATCGSIFAFFTALMIAYYWRSRTPPFWEHIQLPHTLWVSTAFIVLSSLSFEIARRVYRRGLHRAAKRLLMVTAAMGMAFLASQLTAWRQLIRLGAYLAQNPYSTFFYLFTGLHGAHLAGGLVALFVVLLGRTKRRELVDVFAFYWHFLGILWFALFAVLLYV